MVHRTFSLFRDVYPVGTGSHSRGSYGWPFVLCRDWEKLYAGRTWIDGATQIFFAYSVGMGALPALGSYNKFHHDCFRYWN